MKKYLITLLLLFLCITSIHAQKDSIITRSTLYGIGHTNLLDTYLSPMEYTGPGLSSRQYLSATCRATV